MLATIRDDTWNMLNMQRINPISKKWDYSDIPGGGHKQIKGPAHMVEGDHYLRKPPTPTHKMLSKYMRILKSWHNNIRLGDPHNVRRWPGTYGAKTSTGTVKTKLRYMKQ